MPDQLALFSPAAPKPAAAPPPTGAPCYYCHASAGVEPDGTCSACGERVHATCPRVPGARLCVDARQAGCPSAAVCEGLGRSL